MLRSARKLLLVCAALFVVVDASSASDLAVIVHKDNSTKSLSQKELAQIFRAEQQEWKSGDAVVLCLPRSGTSEKQVLLERVYKMEEAELKRYWTTLVYQNRIAEQPKSFASAAVLLRVVEKTKGAIAVVRQSDIPKDAAVCVVAIDDKHPGDAGYPFADSKPKHESVEPPPQRVDPVEDANFAPQDDQDAEPRRFAALEKRLGELEGQLAENASSSHEEGDGPKLELRGFGQVQYTASSVDAQGSNAGSNEFSLGTLDFFPTAKLSDRVSMLAEIGFEAGTDNETHVDVERYIVKYRVSDAFNVQLGRFHTTLGYWNEAFHHGEWLQTSIDRPEVLKFEDDGGPLPVHLVGAVFKGHQEALATGLDWTVEVGNGRGPTPDPPETVVDANDSKAVNLALSIAPEALEGLRFGGGIYLDRVPSNADAAAGALHGEFDERIVDLFTAFRDSKWEFEAEYFAIDHRVPNGSFGWYTQFARHFGSWTPYVRVDDLHLDDADPYYANHDDRTTYSVGVRWDVCAWDVLKLQFDYTDVDAQGSGAGSVRRAVIVQSAFVF